MTALAVRPGQRHAGARHADASRRSTCPVGSAVEGGYRLSEAQAQAILERACSA